MVYRDYTHFQCPYHPLVKCKMLVTHFVLPWQFALVIWSIHARPSVSWFNSKYCICMSEGLSGILPPFLYLWEVAHHQQVPVLLAYHQQHGVCGFQPGFGSLLSDLLLQCKVTHGLSCYMVFLNFPWWFHSPQNVVTFSHLHSHLRIPWFVINIHCSDFSVVHPFWPICRPTSLMTCDCLFLFIFVVSNGCLLRH